MKGLAPPKTLTIALAFAALLLAPPAHAQTKLRVGICARTVSMGVGSPFAIAMKMGWFKQEGLDVEIVPLPGSTDCVKSVATGLGQGAELSRADSQDVDHPRHRLSGSTSSGPSLPGEDTRADTA